MRRFCRSRDSRCDIDDDDDDDENSPLFEAKEGAAGAFPKKMNNSPQQNNIHNMFYYVLHSFFTAIIGIIYTEMNSRRTKDDGFYGVFLVSVCDVGVLWRVMYRGAYETNGNDGGYGTIRYVRVRYVCVVCGKETSRRCRCRRTAHSDFSALNGPADRCC